MKRHLDNFEGALPLLLLGSVLVVYAGILASQEVGSHTSHLPLWGILGGVGAVIVGAGIYSTFLEPEPGNAPAASEEWVTVPRAEWEARSTAPQVPVRSRPPSKNPPIWWEGPATVPPAPLSRTSAGTETPSPARRPAPSDRTPPALERRIGPQRSVPRPTARYSYKELTEELSELESMVYGSPSLTPGTSARVPSSRGPGPSTCMDCDRPLTAAAMATPCRNCGRGLCARCAASSRSEDGEVRCIDCRARAT